MVRVYGAQLSDLSDRAARLMGVAHGHGTKDGTAESLTAGRGRQLVTRQMPYWQRNRVDDILYMDDFEGTLRWTQSLGTLAKTSAQGEVFEGNSSLKLTTGAVAGNQAGGYVGLPAMYQGPAPGFTAPGVGVDKALQCLCISMRWRFEVAANTTPRYFEIHWLNDDEDFAWEAAWRFRRRDGAVNYDRWQYRTAAAVWTNYGMGVWPIDWTIDGWQYIELWLIQRNDGLWKFFQHRHNNWQWGAYDNPIQSAASGGSGFGELYLQCETEAAAATNVLVDGLTVSKQYQLPESYTIGVV